jgi:iron complex outermembrane receptor protein
MSTRIHARLICGLLAGVAAAALQAEPAFAQSASRTAASANTTDVEELVVTARRREEKLADVPISASVVTGDELVKRGTVTTVEDVLAGVPGLRFFNTSSPMNSEVSIRGSSTARATSAESAIGLYRDDVYVGGGVLGGRSFTTLDLFDVGRVEVLRGTQGALYGRDAVGGSINIISAQPTQTFSGFALADYGFNNHKPEYQAVVNAPINEYVSTRFGMTYVDQTKGFLFARDLGQYIDQDKGASERAQIRFTKEKLDIDLLAEHSQLVQPALALRLILLPGATQDPKGYIQDKYNYTINSPDIAKQQLNNFRLSVNYDLGWGKLTSTTSYRDRHSFLAFDADGLDAAQMAILKAAGGTIPDINLASLSDDRTRTAYQDIHLAGEHGAFTWLAGAEYLHQLDGFIATTGKTPTKASPTVGTVTPTDSEYTSYAGYASLGYDITKQWNVEAEGRYTDDQKHTQGNRFDRTTGLQSGGAGFVINSNYDHDNPAWNVTLSYKPMTDYLFYAKIGSSYRAGGFNNNLGDPRQQVAVPPSYSPETSLAYEAGLKVRPLPQIFVTAAIYQVDTSGFIVQGSNLCAATNPVCPVAVTNFLTNAGDARNSGEEVEITGHHEIFGGPLSWELDGSHQDGKIRTGAYAGQDLPQVPTWIAGGNIDYRYPLGVVTLFSNINYRAQWGGAQDINLPSTGVSNYTLQDYQIFNIRAGVEYRNWQVSAYANNAFADSYVVFFGPTVQRSSQPRVYGMQLRYHW